MTTVYLLIAILINNTYSGPKVTIDTAVFESAEKCLRNKEHNEKTLKKQYDDVRIECQTRTMIRGR